MSALVAQRIERLRPKEGVGGSSPSEGATFEPNQSPLSHFAVVLLGRLSNISQTPSIDLRDFLSVSQHLKK
jgi:hypothetical protein